MNNEADEDVAHRYKLQKLVARGGTAEIWRGTDWETGAAVAVKRLLPGPDRQVTGESRQRLLQEAEALQGLQHPNIVRYLAADIDHDGLPYLVLEWLDGEDLARRRRRAPLSADQVQELCLQALAGLQACHARGIVHRDLKPENMILLSGDEPILKLVDFGLAWQQRTTPQLTREGMVMGTLHYLSPEQVTPGTGVDHRTDIYSMGVVLYELLTGQVPFAGEQSATVLLKIVSETPPLPTLVRPELPDWTDDVVLRAMMRSPADRFQSAAEMREALLEGTREREGEGARGEAAWRGRGGEGERGGGGGRSRRAGWRGVGGGGGGGSGARGRARARGRGGRREGCRDGLRCWGWAAPGPTTPRSSAPCRTRGRWSTACLAARWASLCTTVRQRSRP